MADNAGCYSDLLFNDDGCFDFASSFSCDDNNTNLNAPKMLCFGDNQNCKKTDQKPSLTRIADSSSKNNKKRNGSNNQNAGDSAGNQRNGKKRKTENSTGGGHAKGVKREKLGERISALQQLVSPFGKTDTASVLHEAFCYIRFLHDQVQVLSSPYLQRSEASNGAEKGKDDDLRSRGLCLVPVDLTVHVAHSNGADLWSSAAMIHTV